MNPDLPQCPSYDKGTPCQLNQGHTGLRRNTFYKCAWKQTEKEIQASLKDGVDPSGNDWHEPPVDLSQKEIEAAQEEMSQHYGEATPAPGPLFKPGDVVKLKSGGPAMTVNEVNETVMCAVHNALNGSIECYILPEFALILVGDGNKPVEKPSLSPEDRAERIWNRYQWNAMVTNHPWESLGSETQAFFLNAVNFVLDGPSQGS